MKVLWRIAKFLLLTIYSLCGLALVVFLVPATGFEAKSIATGSMRPTIPTGSLVIIHKTPLNQLKVGDVVTYTKSVNPPVTITHRIVKTETKAGAPYFIVKGDANQVPDPAVPGGAIVGKVVFHMPYIGRAALDIRNPIAIVIIVIIPGLLIIVDEIIRLRRTFSKTDVKKSEPMAPPPPPAPSAPPEPEPAPEPTRPTPTAAPQSPRPRRTLDGMKPRQLIIALAALSLVSFGIKTTYAELTSNAVTISKIHLTAGAASSPTPSPTPTPSPHPTKIADCLNNGYKHYGFKSLAACIVYVVLHQPIPTPPPLPSLPPLPTPRPIPSFPPFPTPLPTPTHFSQTTPTPTPTPSPAPSPSPSPKK
jgi:signal peptidase I